MNILVFDNQNLDRAKSMAKALNQNGATTIISYQNVFYDANEARIATPASFTLVLWHKTDEAAYADAKPQTNYEISFAGGPGAEIPRAIFATDAFTNDEARHIVTTLQEHSGAATVKEQLVGYWKKRKNETQAALCLLCEAWLLKNWPDRVTYPKVQTLRTALQIEEKKPQLPEGIDLKPPSKRDEWLKPFREMDDATDPLPAILDEISTDDGKTLVRNFFSKPQEVFAPTFDNVADLFLSLSTTLKASS